MQRRSGLRIASSLSLCVLLGATSGCQESARPNAKAADGASADASAPVGAPNNQPKRVAVHGEAPANAVNPHAGAAGPHAQAGKGRAVPTQAAVASAPREIVPDGKTSAITVQGLSFSVPAQWERQPPANRMRIDQYDVPGPAGGASLGVFRFPGGGGSAQSNIERWIGQFDQPDGRPSKEVAKIETVDVAGLQVTTVSITGTYQGSMGMQGAPAATAQSESQLLAAIVNGSGDPYFFKLSGPQKTVGLWSEQWDAMVKSFALAAAPADPAVVPKPD